MVGFAFSGSACIHLQFSTEGACPFPRRARGERERWQPLTWPCSARARWLVRSHHHRRLPLQDSSCWDWERGDPRTPGPGSATHSIINSTLPRM
uniref:Uncharacterized protein n=1 Tax=Arundo donax TaxID=35708 RepID=A0A0A8XY19_ARUDO